MDRAGIAYWDALFGGQAPPEPVDPDDDSLDNFVDRRLHELFLSDLPTGIDEPRLLEVGCGRSRWLPYFARHHGYLVTGLDYSPVGCEQARVVLARAGVEGEVVEGDMFAPPDRLLGQFDAVVSFGLVEHFSDTASAVEALGRFLRPGGVLVTLIPNMGRTVVGTLQRFLDRAVYDVHVPIDRERLANAHRRAGLSVRKSGYFLGVNLSVVNIAGWGDTPRRRRVMRLLSGVSKVAWMLEKRGFRLPPNRLTSPYVLTIATKPPESTAG